MQKALSADAIKIGIIKKILVAMYTFGKYSVTYLFNIVCKILTGFKMIENKSRKNNSLLHNSILFNFFYFLIYIYLEFFFSYNFSNCRFLRNQMSLNKSIRNSFFNKLSVGFWYRTLKLIFLQIVGNSGYTSACWAKFEDLIICKSFFKSCPN